MQKTGQANSGKKTVSHVEKALSQKGGVALTTTSFVKGALKTRNRQTGNRAGTGKGTPKHLDPVTQALSQLVLGMQVNSTLYLGNGGGTDAGLQELAAEARRRLHNIKAARDTEKLANVEVAIISPVNVPKVDGLQVAIVKKDGRAFAKAKKALQNLVEIGDAQVDLPMDIEETVPQPDVEVHKGVGPASLDGILGLVNKTRFFTGEAFRKFGEAIDGDKPNPAKDGDQPNPADDGDNPEGPKKHD